MRLDNIDRDLKEIPKPALEGKMAAFHKSFESRIKGEDEAAIKADEKDSTLLENINGKTLVFLILSSFVLLPK